MSPYERINPYRGTGRPPFRRSPWGRRVSAALPWVFVLGIAVGSMLPIRQWVPQWVPSHWPLNRSHDTDVIWQRAGALTSGTALMSSGRSMATPSRRGCISRRGLILHTGPVARHRRAGAEGILSARTANGGSGNCRAARSARPGRCRDLQYRSRQISGTRCRRRCDEEDRKRLGCAARIRPCARLQWWPPLRLVRKFDPLSDSGYRCHGTGSANKKPRGCAAFSSRAFAEISG